MKKLLLVLFLVGNISFAQKLTKEQLIDVLADKACECTSKQEINKDNFELTVGICLLEGINAYEKDVEKYFGKNILSNDKKMEELATNIGAKMALKCPAVFKSMIGDELTDVDIVDTEDLMLSGTISDIKFEQFLTFNVKEDSGKNNQFILLSNFDNAFLLTDKVLKTADPVDVSYYVLELFDAKLGQFVSYKIVTDIIKK
jgi:hypothetical protein